MNPQPKTSKRTRQEYHQFSRGQAEFNREVAKVKESLTQRATVMSRA